MTKTSEVEENLRGSANIKIKAAADDNWQLLFDLAKIPAILMVLGLIPVFYGVMVTGDFSQ